MSRYELIAAERANAPVTVLCSLMDVTRAGFYAWSKGRSSKRADSDAALVVAIEEVHRTSRSVYGSPRVHAQLRKRGTRVSRKRVARLMRQEGLRGKRRRRFVKTTVADPDHAPAPNLLARNFAVDAPNRVWAGDITYVRTREGWLYLAVLLDLHSRRVVGWSMSDSLETQGALDALDMALAARRPPRGLLHHTDRGCQYTSARYRKRLKRHGLVASMSRKGECWDNAVSESFFASLKIELVDEADFRTRDEARARIFDYIERFYNRARLHSTLDYESPVAFEKRLKTIQLSA